MERSVQDRQSTRGWRRLACLCCILLVVFGTTAELIHAHPSGRTSTDCSLCVMAHSAAQTTEYTVAPLVLRSVAKCADPEPAHVRHSLDNRLSIRPPPASPAFA
jgi:hypothetical protein